ncbi:MAG: tRNA (guanosine(37)-N1)-methyltransferase TrmD [Anaerolineales bacterium]|nr:MAG: tRNA (guanosine(37)-N1)-methyltransferase TrmD [Anaerolineales bacterium]
MRFDVFTVLPEVMFAYLDASILGRAQDSGRLSVGIHNLRDYTTDRHRTTDDEPYGGGGGMLMKPEPVFAAAESVLGDRLGSAPIILLTPQGRVFSQSVARELAQHDQIALICGRYEGVDERIRAHLVTDEISIGDYVLTGGELPALILIDAVSRLVPGVLGDVLANEKDSHSQGFLEHPHYTRPPDFRGWQVPEILRSGDHARIERWRTKQSLLRTYQRRPDMMESMHLSQEQQRLLEEALNEQTDQGGKGNE